MPRLFTLLCLCALAVTPIGFAGKSSAIPTQGCQPDETTMCLQQGRFEVTGTWTRPNDASGPVHMVELTPDSGYFTFFNENNVEGVIKVLDACEPGGRYWVFMAGLTNVSVLLRVRDVFLDATQVYFNVQGRNFATTLDTRTFTCDAPPTPGIWPPSGAETTLHRQGREAEVTAELETFRAEVEALTGDRDPSSASPAPALAGTSRQLPGLVTLDLAGIAFDNLIYGRIGGSGGNGRLGLPVAGGKDLDGDGFADFVLASFLESPSGRDRAGRVYGILGDGWVWRARIAETASPLVIAFDGAREQETAGNEVWVDDVTGDGVADLLICRQNYTTPEGPFGPERVGAGALTVVPGSSALRDFASQGGSLDLGALPAELNAITVAGPQRLGRFCIWTRTGDVDGDGVADIAVGADQEGPSGAAHRGAVYVIRGGSHLSPAVLGTALVDLAAPLGHALEGNLARILPPANSVEYHFGATCQIADLDGNGRGEVLGAAALLRGGASVPAAGQPPSTAHAQGGAPGGALYIAWDDNFPVGPWPAGYTVSLGNPPGSTTVLRGEPGNRAFGEEITSGDFDGDGQVDLFAGDLGGDGSLFGSRPSSGTGTVLWSAEMLRGFAGAVDALGPQQRITRLLGADVGHIAGDTAVAGDFDGDGVDDLAVSSPHASPQGRDSAGAVHLLHGQLGGWPDLIDLRQPPIAQMRITEIQGIRGDLPGDRGDTLGYSMASGDINDDGRPDLLINEMLGNGLAVDTGNLLILSGQAFTTGEPCVEDGQNLCLRDGRFRLLTQFQANPALRGVGRAEALTDEAGYFWFFHPDNLEVLAKVLKGCPVNDRYWAFSTGLTNVETQLVVQDTLRSETYVYYTPPTPLGYQPVYDVGSFDVCP